MNIYTSCFKIPAPLLNITHFFDECRQHEEIKLEHALRFGRRLYCFRHVDVLTAHLELTSVTCATNLRKASSDFYCGFGFTTDQTLKNK